MTATGFSKPAEQVELARIRSRRSRNQVERGAVTGAHDAEVPAVDGGDFGDIEPFGRCHHRSVDGSQRQIAVGVNEFGDPEPVTRSDRLSDEVARREVAEESHLDAGPESSADEVCDLGDHQARHDQRSRVGEQQLERGSMMPIIRIDIRIERPRVDDEGYDAASVARISSMRSEMSSCPLRPAPAAASLRRPPR